MTRAQHSARITLLTTIQTVAIVIQTVAVVIGVIFALSQLQLQRIKEQNKQAKTMASAQLTVDLGKIFDTKKYDDIAFG